MVWRFSYRAYLHFLHFHGKTLSIPGLPNHRTKGHQVISSIIAAWSDVTNAFTHSVPVVSTGISAGILQSLLGTVRGLNAGYFWMLFNCLASAAYVGHPAAKPL